METLNPSRARLGSSVTAGFDVGSHDGNHVGSGLMMMIITTTTGFTTHHRHNP